MTLTKLEEAKKELEHFKKTGIPRCIQCKKPMIQIDEYTWKNDCKHNKRLRLSIG